MEKIAEKIQKLLAKANSSTHPEEAETFMAKAHALLEQHGLSLFDLGKLDSEDPIGRSQDKEMLRANSAASWRTMVAGQLAIYYGCKMVTTNYRGDNFTYWTVFGRESARITFMLMWPFIDRQILSIARQETAKGNHATTKKAHGAIGRAFALRLANLLKEREAAAPAPTGASMALVPVDLIKLAMEEAFPHLKIGKAKTVYTTAADREAAERISLNQQTAAPAGTLRITK